jgi:HTH-type transcriptional regulator / antitoxin HigA
MMEQKGLTRRDLEPAIASRGRVSEVLTRKRPLTLPMVRASRLLDIPLETLVQPYQMRPATHGTRGLPPERLAGPAVRGRG